MISSILNEDNTVYRQAANRSRKSAHTLGVIEKYSVSRSTRNDDEFARKRSHREEKNSGWIVAPVEHLRLQYPRSTVLPMIEEHLAELSKLEDCWDGEEAKAPHPASLKSVRSFMADLEKRLRTENIMLRLPELNPYQDGSIDVVWRSKTAHVMLNFSPAQPTLPAFYTDRYDYKTGFSGRIEIENPGTWEYLIIALGKLHKDGLAY